MAILRATIKALLYEQLVVNVLHFNRIDFVSADLAGLGNELLTNWVTPIKAQQALQLQYTEIRVDKMNGNIAEESATVFTALAGGAGSNVQVSPNIAMILQKSTGLPGRRNRGRVFIGGLTPGALNVGMWSTATLTSWATITGNLKTRYCQPTATSNFILVLYGNHGSGWESISCNNIQASSLPGAMRSRLRGHGA